MGMSTGTKVAIGCGIVAVLGAPVFAVTLGVGAFWLKGKAEEMTGGLEGMTAKAEEIESWAIQVAVYQSAWASEIEKETGQMPADAMRENMEAASRAMEEARKSGAPGTEALSSEEMDAAIAETARMAEQGIGGLDVPRSNVALFRKYEADIKKYAMHGLAFLGL